MGRVELGKDFHEDDTGKNFVPVQGLLISLIYFKVSVLLGFSEEFC